MFVFMYIQHKYVCVLLSLNPNWLSLSGPQESSDSSNTTVEDEDVKGKTDDQTLVTHVCCWQLTNSGWSTFYTVLTQ